MREGMYRLLRVGYHQGMAGRRAGMFHRQQVVTRPDKVGAGTLAGLSVE